MAIRDDLAESINTAEKSENNDKIPFKFEITENISKIGISNIVIDRGVLEFIIAPQNICYVYFIPGKTTPSKLCNDIEKKLSKKLEGRIDDVIIFDSALCDIETQVIQYRDKILNTSSDYDNVDDNDKSENDKFKTKFAEDVISLRKQFKESPQPYSEWRSKVAEKYDILRKTIENYYPDAWPLMEFCLSVKSILNILDNTLPFMGVIIARPSSMKTMVIQLFRKYPGSFYTDSFTPSSLVSHNASLTEEQLQKVDMMPKMKDRLVLVPELAPIFTAKDDDLQKMMGIITRVLDGHGLENDSGAQGHRKYGDTMFVLLGAVVEIPPRVWKLLGTLGHKIYFFRPALRKKSIKDLIEIARSNNFAANNKEIEEALLDYLKTFDAAPETVGKIKLENGIVKVRWDEDVEEEQDKAIEHIAQLANLLASLRGEVYVSQSKYMNNKNSYGGDNIQQQHQQQHQQPRQTDGQDYDTDFPIIEDPSRAVILLRNIAIGHAKSQGRNFLVLDDVPMAIRVALSTAPIRRVKVLDLLLKSDIGELTTSEITTRLSISQPIATKTMRGFHALGIAYISAIGNYENSELVIRLKSGFEWFRGEEFLELKGDFVPSDEDKDDSIFDISEQEDTEDFSKRDANDSDTVVHTTLIEEILSYAKDREQNNAYSGGTIETCDNNKGCHTLKENPPRKTQQENSNGYSTTGENSNSTSKQAKHLQHNRQQKDDDEDLNQQLSDYNDSEEDTHNNKPIKTTTNTTATSITADTSDKQDEETNSVPLWCPKLFERVTLSQESKNCHMQKEASISGKEDDNRKDPAFNISLQEILDSIKLANGSIIAVNSAIESVHRHNELVRNYLGDKLTARENRKVRDLDLEVIRHQNIKVIKHKPQLLVKWHENGDSVVVSNRGETA